jgi:hypothetical protein
MYLPGYDPNEQQPQLPGLPPGAGAPPEGEEPAQRRGAGGNPRGGSAGGRADAGRQIEGIKTQQLTRNPVAWWRCGVSTRRVRV